MSLLPSFIASREPIGAPMSAEPAITSPIGQTIAPVAANRVRLPKLLAKLRSLVWAVARTTP